MEEELENRCRVLDHQKSLDVVDQIVTFGPHKARDKVMNPNRENIFIMGSVEDHGLSFGRSVWVHAPEEVVSEFLGLRLLEPNNPAARWVHSRENVPNYTVLAASVQSLKHYKERVLPLRVHQVLQLVHLV